MIPVNKRALVKALKRALEAEGIRPSTVPADALAMVAEQSGGDVRSALNSLQFLVTSLRSAKGGLYTRQEAAQIRTKLAGTPRYQAATAGGTRKSKKTMHATPAETGLPGRDEAASLFRVCGRFLHNMTHRLPPAPAASTPMDGDVGESASRKRRAPDATGVSDEDDEDDIFDDFGDEDLSVLLRKESEALQPVARGALAFEPEDTLRESGLAPRTTAGWLEEDFVEFFSRLGDIAECYESLGAADVVMNGAFHTTLADEVEQVAAAIAGRAVLWSNQRPVEGRYVTLRKPRWYDRLRSSAHARASPSDTPPEPDDSQGALLGFLPPSRDCRLTRSATHSTGPARTQPRTLWRCGAASGGSLSRPRQRRTLRWTLCPPPTGCTASMAAAPPA